MADLADIREGLALNLQAIPDLQVSAYLLSRPTPPTVMVGGPEEISWLEEYGGRPNWTLPVIVYTGMATDVGAQKLLDRYLAPDGLESIRAAIEADPTLGGAVADLAVTSTTGYRTYLVGGGDVLYLGAEWSVTVYD